MAAATSIGIIIGCSVGIGIIWLTLGRRISQVFDCFFPGRPTPLSTDRMLITFDPAGISSSFAIGSWGYPLSWAWPPWPCELKVVFDEKGQLALSADGRSFTFGPVRERWSDPVKIKPSYLFVPDDGDVVSFTRDISRLPWPTPFTFNILGASVPKWKRYAYDRLRWTKRSGDTLEIIWTDEYWFYRGSGWSDCCMNRLSRVRIHAGSMKQ